MRKSLMMLIVLAIITMGIAFAETSPFAILDDESVSITKSVDYTVKVGKTINISTPARGDYTRVNQYGYDRGRNFYDYNELKWHTLDSNIKTIVTDTFKAESNGLYSLSLTGKKPGQVKITVNLQKTWYVTEYYYQYSVWDHKKHRVSRQVEKTAYSSYDIIVEILADPATKITLNQHSLTILGTDTKTLKASYSPNTASPTLYWTSSNRSVATVDQNGKIISVAPGTCKITVKDTKTGLFDTCDVIVKQVLTNKITINKKKITIYAGNTYQLSASVLPANANKKTFTWKSENTKIAKIDKNGKVTGVAPGTVKIKAITNDSGISDYCTVTVLKKKPVTGVTLKKKDITIGIGEIYQLVEVISPTDAYNKKVTWSTANKSIATVGTTGKVTGKKAGSTKVTVTTNDGKYTCVCKVTVKDFKVTGVSLKSSKASLVIDQTYQLTAVISPTNATNKKVTWKSNNTKIATVDSKGKVTAKNYGTAKIVVTTVDGSFSKTATITVKDYDIKICYYDDITNKNTIHYDDFKLLLGKEQNLFVKASPLDLCCDQVTWTSSNKKVATVNEYGEVKAVGKGTATITITRNSAKDTIKVTVISSAEEINIFYYNNNKKCYGDLNLSYNGSITLDVDSTSLGIDSSTDVTWTSSNKKVVTIDKEGYLDAVNYGTATITATSKKNKNVKATMKVTVKDPTSIKLYYEDTNDKICYSNLVMNQGGKRCVDIESNPIGLSSVYANWTSSNENVVKIGYSYWQVEAVGKGTATITATYKNNNVTLKATMKVTVK